MVVALYIATIKTRANNMSETNNNTQVSAKNYTDYTIENMMTSSVDEPITDAFVNHLHATLDVYQLLDNFNDVFREKVQCNGIEYNDEATKTYLLNGKTGHPSCIYTLRYEEEILGTISISRDSVFLDYEIEIIEVLLAGLTLPLRNALRYKKSIQFSQRDELTGLRSGYNYHDIAELEVRRTQRYKVPFSILLFDINNFDLINSQYGRAAGDALLIEVSRRLERKARSSDIVYRNNGDEFIVFLPNTENSEAKEAAERIRGFILMDKCIYLDKSIAFTISVSATTVTYEDTASKLMLRAKKALLLEKALEKNGINKSLEVEPLQVGNH